MKSGNSVCKIKGHNKYRGRIMINNRIFTKYFSENKLESEKQCKAWKEYLKLQFKERYDGAKSWIFFRTHFLEWLGQNKSKYNDAYKTRTIQEYIYAFDKTEQILSPRYMADITIKELGILKTELEKDAVLKRVGFYGANKVLICFKAAIKWGIERGYVPDMSLGAVKLLQVSKIKVKIFTPKEIELMLKYSPPKWRAAILLGFDSGCRPEEVYNLLLNKLDLTNGFAWVSPNKEDKQNSITSWTPKAGKSRLIRLTPRTIDEIKKIDSKSLYLITDRSNKPYKDTNFSNSFKQNLENINKQIEENETTPVLIRGTFKLLRKSYCTTRQGEGAALEDISNSMAHNNEAITIEHYTDMEYAPLKNKSIARQKERLRALDKYMVALKY
ncbi:integrase [Elusimicrobium simillimum]|uniref:tyrosine-type recombinase/integrase n=1 Tax=Elusimicrobium simillimum TaxID=3143438 RepID=UPI003C6F0E1B